MLFSKWYNYIFLVFVSILVFISCDFNQQKYSSKVKFNSIIDSLINNKISTNKIIDSLLLDVKLASNDTSKINALNQLPENYASINITTAKLFATEAYRWSDSINYEKGKFNSLARIGFFYGANGNPDSAIFLLKKSLQYSHLSSDIKLQTYCYSVLGNIYLRLGKLDSCELYYKKGLHNAILTKDLKYIGYNNSVKANYYLYSDQLDSCIYYFEKNIIFLNQHTLYKQLGYDYRSLGDLYSSQGNYTNAIINLKKAMFYATIINEKRLLGSCYITLAYVFEKLDEAVTAINYYKKGLVYAKESNDIFVEYTSYFGLTFLYQKKKSYDQAFFYFNKAIPMAKSMQRFNQLASLYLTAGELAVVNGSIDIANKYADSSYIYINEKNPSDHHPQYYYLKGLIFLKQGRFKNGLGSLLKGYDYSLKSNDIEGQKTICQSLSEIYFKNNNFEKAFIFSTTFKKIEDSLRNDLSIKKLANVAYTLKEQELKLAQQKRENELALINQKTLQQKNYWLYGSILVTILLIISVIGLYFYFKQKQLKVNQLKLIEEQKRLLLEQKFLRSQMNPHLIYNSLYSIQTFVLNNNSQLASDYLSKFARLMRMVLEQSREEFIAIEDEVKCLELYTSLQHLIFENKFDYNIVVDVAIDTENYSIPPMLTQPFIENAIKHGMNGLNKKGNIKITYSLVNDLIHITITDNGVGISNTHHSKNTNHQSLSTTITNERLELFSQQHHHHFSVEVSDMLDSEMDIVGTTVLLKVPFKKLY